MWLRELVRAQANRSRAASHSVTRLIQSGSR